MSAIVKLVAPAELLFQPGDEKENAATNKDAKRVEPSSLCEPEAKFWQLSSKTPIPSGRADRNVRSRAVPVDCGGRDNQLFH
jgi:hypothetical protein